MKTKHGFILFSLLDSPAGIVCWIKGSEITGVQPQGKYAIIHQSSGEAEAVLHTPDEILDAIKQSYDEMRKK